MKYRELFLWGFCGFFVLFETVNANFNGEQKSLSNLNQNLYNARSKFKCPQPYGTYPDPENCSSYYVCVSSVAVPRKCKRIFKFDVNFKKCFPPHIAVCIKDLEKKRTTPSITTIPSSDSTDKGIFVCTSFSGLFPHPNDCSKFFDCFLYKATVKTCPVNALFDAVKKACRLEKEVHCGDRKRPEGIFVCPSFTGIFPHPNDCSKFFDCFLYIATVKSCPENTLFDVVKKACRPEKEVHCGDRKRPGFTTTPLPTETTQSITTATATETTTEHITTETAVERTERITTETATETTTTEIISTTTESTTQTTEQICTLPDTTTVATTEDAITASFPTGPPEYDCDEEDVDCIIKETGDPQEWFKCSRDIGAFPHPSSDKLFIFCMNWIPTAKKCGLNRVFSKELLTCTDIA